MPRNSFGFNLDTGLALRDEDDWGQLWVSAYQDEEARIHAWLDDCDGPLLLAGQIGSGKSTLLNHALKTYQPGVHVTNRAVLRVAMEELVQRPSAGSYWAVALRAFLVAPGLIGAARVELQTFLRDIAKGDSVEALEDRLANRPVTPQSWKEQENLLQELAGHETYLTGHLIPLLLRGLVAEGLDPLVLFTGADKYGPRSSNWTMLRPVLEAFDTSQTLYELNAVHVLSRARLPFRSDSVVLLPAMTDGAIREVLGRRLGVYSQGQTAMVERLTSWSGGNPRQALHLLQHYLSAGRQTVRSLDENVQSAIQRTRTDFFFGSPAPNPELLRLLRTDGHLHSGTANDPNFSDEVAKAVLGNWVMLLEDVDGLKWSIAVNPLVPESAYDATSPTSVESRVLDGYVSAKGMSSVDLNIPEGVDRFGEESGEVVKSLLRADGYEEPIKLNVAEALDSLSVSLLSATQAGGALITFSDASSIPAVQEYVFAKLEEQSGMLVHHCSLNAGQALTTSLLELPLSDGDQTLLSVQLSRDLDNDTLDALDLQRDRLLERPMLWWVPREVVGRYLSRLPHLRQVFICFELDSEIRGQLSAEDIEADLEFFREMPDEDRPKGILARFERILMYLQEDK